MQCQFILSFSMTTSHFHVTYNPVYTHVINLSFSVFNGGKGLKTEEKNENQHFRPRWILKFGTIERHVGVPAMRSFLREHGGEYAAQKYGKFPHRGDQFLQFWGGFVRPTTLN